MKNNITKDIEYMKYVLGYKRGVVISEQPIKKTSLSEQNNNEKPPVGCIDGDCENGTGTYRYSNLNTYTGEFKDNLPNGQGTDTMLRDDKSIMFLETGEFKDGSLYNGQTTHIQYDGESFYREVKNGVVGEAKKGKPPEQNKETEQNNDQSTTGECTGNCKDGEGTYKDKDRVYSGKFKDGDLYNGIITFTSQDGNSKYSEVKDGVQGELKDGEPPNNSIIDPNNATVQTNSGDCKEPTAPTHRYKNDRNYRYAKSGDCWWAKNIINNKWINLTELVKTKPKVQSSIDKLDKGLENGPDLINL